MHSGQIKAVSRAAYSVNTVETFLLQINVLLICMYVYHMHAWCQIQEVGCRLDPLQLELTNSCDISYGCWESNPSLQKEQYML